ncbi:MAG: ribonuclease HI [Actinobacteria bacterium]|nr:ribonuclease HI [Actinomycetota bacterium]
MEKTPNKKTEIILYADGACSGNPGPGGWAVILKHLSSAKTREFSGCEKQTTNNRMELTAVIRGLEAIRKRSKVTVVTDSQYLVKGMTEWIDNWIAKNWRTANKKPVKNVDLWQRLLELSGKHDVSWQWIEGHAGHPENERCDQLAVRATAEI